MESIQEKRHIQDHANAQRLIPHWGYADRVYPCTNDPGSCDYLDVVYLSHDRGVRYTWIMWVVIGGLLLIGLLLRLITPRRKVALTQVESQKARRQGSFYRGWRAFKTAFRRFLLPEGLVSFFGHVTRLQLAVLGGLSTYLIIFTFVGYKFKIWITPVKGTTLHNTRSSLGPFADRVGVLAYALTPLVVGLSTRENILSLLTGIPYQHFNFLHRWTGRIIFVQSWLHAIGWIIIEARLYQPQPKVWKTFIRQRYMVFGVIAQIFITLIYVLSIKRVVKWTGYEFFRKLHYVLGALYLGACWGHWPQLNCWMIASIGVLFLDRACRLLRIVLIHFNFRGEDGIGWKNAQAKFTNFEDADGDIVVRAEFDFKHSAWSVGQHFYLCFPELSIWQAHPFTPATPPQAGPLQKHVYIVRCMKGQTKPLPSLAKGNGGTSPVILTGPFGGNLLSKEPCNILAVAGGTGISFSLPALMAAVAQTSFNTPRALRLVWVIRRSANMSWMATELEELKSLALAQKIDVQVHIFVTRDSTNDSSEKDHGSISSGQDSSEASDDRDSEGKGIKVSSNTSEPQVEYLANHHPSMDSIVESFVQHASTFEGRVRVLASGPSGMGQDLRTAVAKQNKGGSVWKGEEHHDVELYFDNRLT